MVGPIQNHLTRDSGERRVRSLSATGAAYRKVSTILAIWSESPGAWRCATISRPIRNGLEKPLALRPRGILRNVDRTDGRGAKFMTAELFGDGLDFTRTNPLDVHLG